MILMNQSTRPQTINKAQALDRAKEKKQEEIKLSPKIYDFRLKFIENL